MNNIAEIHKIIMDRQKKKESFTPDEVLQILLVYSGELKKEQEDK